MLTYNDNSPAGYLVTYGNGDTQVMKNMPAATEPNIRCIDSLYKQIPRLGLSDATIITLCDLEDADPAVQTFVIAAARRMMGEIQKMDKDRILRPVRMPDCLRMKVPEPAIPEPHDEPAHAA